MGYFKWIGAGVGFYLSGFRFIGAFLGFLFGSFIDNFSRASQYLNESKENGGRNSFHSSQDIFNFYQRQTQQSDFPTMLLALSATVMKADDRVMKSELEYVKTFLKQQFGNRFTKAHLHTLKTFIEQPHTLPIQQICYDIKMRTHPEVRIQLLHYLFGIAKADGNVSLEETKVLQQISTLLGISSMDFTSVRNMFYRDTESDFKVLGVDRSSSDDEIKKAYRQMAIRYHPDKVAHLGEEYQKGAKEKFQKIQDAYENIKKERNL